MKIVYPYLTSCNCNCNFFFISFSLYIKSSSQYGCLHCSGMNHKWPCSIMFNIKKSLSLQVNLSLFHSIKRGRIIKPASRAQENGTTTVSYTHLRAHETDSYLVCRLLLEKK